MSGHPSAPEDHGVEPRSRREYSFVFERAVGRGGYLRYLSRPNGEWRHVAFEVDDSAFLFRALPQLPAIVADMVDLTAAIYAADRLSPQRLDRSMRRIQITVPLREPEAINNTALGEFQDVLTWATASEWEIDLIDRSAPLRPAESQTTLSCLTPPDAEVVLWSGGLDAVAGVYSRLRSEPGLPLVLLGSGGNDRVLGRQKALQQKLGSVFPGRVSLHQVPIRLRGIRGLPQDRLMRARGVVFTLLGLMSAHVLGRRHLLLHENGVAALNLPYRESSVGLDHVRSVHPFTLQGVSSFVSTVLGEGLGITNPSFLLTKAQMCKPMAEDGRADLPPLTESCDSYHRKSYGQCGYCSSCLLRRQAIAASGLADCTRYVIPHGEPPRRNPSTALHAMLAQVEKFRSACSRSSGEINREQRWEILTRAYPILDDVVDRCAGQEGLSLHEMRQRLVEMYQRYVAEWDSVREKLSYGIVDWEPNRPTVHL